MIKTLFAVTFCAIALSAAQRMSESPNGSIDGSNSVFVLSTLPYPDTVKLVKNGVRLSVNADYTLNAQSITFRNAPGVGDTLIADYDALAPSGSHMLINKATNTCILPSATNKFVAASCAGTDIQNMSVTKSSFGYLFTVKSSGQALDLLNSATTDGTPVIQSSYSGGRGQQWQLISVDSDPFFQVGNSLTNSSSCLAVVGGSVVLQTCNGSMSQKWQWQ